MFYCERCGNAEGERCCERLDLITEPVLCDECYEKALANGEKPSVSVENSRSLTSHKPS